MRKTAEERLLGIAEKRRLAEEKHQQMLAKLAEEETQIKESPKMREAEERRQRNFWRALGKLQPEWGLEHLLAAAKQVHEKPEKLFAEGAELLETLGRGLGGRPKKDA